LKLASFPKLISSLLLAIILVFVSNKIFESSKPELERTSNYALKNQIEEDLTHLLNVEISRVFGKSDLPFTLSSQISFSTEPGNLENKKYYVSGVQVETRRKLAIEEWGKIKTTLKMYLKANGFLAVNGKAKISKKLIAQSMYSGQKWVGALVVISIAFILMLFVILIHSKWHRRLVNRILLAKKKKDEERFDCSAVPYGYMAKVDSQTSKPNIMMWRDLISTLRKSEENVGAKNSLSTLEASI
jgi:hypothetical protein